MTKFILAERVFLLVTELRRALARVLVPDVAVIANAEEAFWGKNAYIVKKGNTWCTCKLQDISNTHLFRNVRRQG